MLLITDTDLLNRYENAEVFLLTQPTADGKNLFFTVSDRKPRHSVYPVGVAKHRAEKCKTYDFTLDFDTYELQTFSRKFNCDQVLIVEDKLLFQYLIDPENQTSSTTQQQSSIEGPDQKASYLEHHSALVKLALIVTKLSLSGNLLILLLLDALLGAWVGQYVCEWWPVAVEEAVPEARSIVEWIRGGTPLGLKLNSQLNQALAKFFTCHVNMWNVYVDVMLPYLRTLTNYIAYIGFIPFTFQCSLVCDIITLSTVHVYCFYGYMCKIYSLWLSALFALLRIFRGLKYNPLRDRVDSLTDADPVILGPIILTIVVFLLPTLFIYYVMFSLMRCCVLIVNFTLGTVMHDLFVLIYDFLITLSTDWKLDVEHIKINRLNDFATIARPTYSKGTRKVLAGGLKRIFRFGELLNLIRHLYMGKIVYPL